MNKSERLLEEWCQKKNWKIERIPEETQRTPDYKIEVNGIRMYAEVKEIIANDEEKGVLKQLALDAYGEEPGKTIREKIKESYGQIKRFAIQDNCSGLLVLYNNSGMFGLGRLDHYHVLAGMFGLQTVPVTVPDDANLQPIFGLDYFGPKKSVADDRNRYLSGIMTIYEDDEKGLMVFFYHNPHAIHTIDPSIIRADNCIQYRKSSIGLNWELVKCDEG